MKVSTVTEVINSEPVVNVFANALKAEKFFATLCKENDATVNPDDITSASNGNYAVFMELNVEVL